MCRLKRTDRVLAPPHACARQWARHALLYYTPDAMFTRSSPVTSPRRGAASSACADVERHSTARRRDGVVHAVEQLAGLRGPRVVALVGVNLHHRLPVRKFEVGILLQ